jgi:hypothetical protein
MKRQVYSRLIIYFLPAITFSLCVFGCGEKDKTKVHTEKVESKQPSVKNSIHTNEADAKEGNTLSAEESELVPINDQIQFEQWKQLVEELKETFSDMQEIKESG